MENIIKDTFIEAPKIEDLKVMVELIKQCQKDIPDSPLKKAYAEQLQDLANKLSVITLAYVGLAGSISALKELDDE